MINAKEFLKALDELEAAKGISKESIINALKEAMEKGFIKQLGIVDDDELEEAKVRVDIDPAKGTIEMYVLKNVVEEVQDDFLEISLEDANKDGAHYQIGDVYEIPVSTDELTKLTAQNIKSVLRQKISEAEKAAIYEAYIGKKDEMIVGTVEKVDDRSTIVNIGRTSIYLPNSQKIPGETFRLGEQIKLYVVDVLNTPKGAQVNVSRTDPGFLRRLFEEEIHEIYDGTVMIMDIAREAGERSKVAVISNDPNVDPIGACIGPNGSRIQKICASLGNVKEKEKIDIIAFNKNPGLYIIEALKPASVVGVALQEEAKKAVAVVRNNELSLAIGKRGVNARLAVRLTGWNIDIKEQDDAMRLGIHYLSADELKVQESIAQMAVDAQTFKDMDSEPIAEEESYFEETPLEHEGSDLLAATETEVEEEVAPVVEPVKVPEPKVATVTTKVKLADLEKELENEKKRRERQAQYAARRKRNYRDDEPVTEKEKEEQALNPSVDPKTYMSIYTEEELAELEREEEVHGVVEDDEDIDYDDFEDYYDDDDR